jgi:hypothetical protein
MDWVHIMIVIQAGHREGILYRQRNLTDGQNEM